jgi:molybdopterin/thiamine biosynthesis adenylyltransferase
VFAPLVGIIGSMQAAQALQLIVRCGQPLSARLLMLDARTMHVDTLRLSRTAQCSVCGSGSGA